MNALCKSCALVALLAGCAGVTTSFADITRQYRPAELGFDAGSDDTFRVVVIGNPFDVSKETFETAIVTEMTGSTLGGPRLAFSTAPDEADRRNHRVVLVFDPPEKGSYSGLSAPDISAAAAAATTEPIGPSGRPAPNAGSSARHFAVERCVISMRYELFF